MALFEFKLKPLQEVVPWGEKPDLNLHWFGLTDGIYYMNVGGEQLFRSSIEILNHWKKKHPDLDVNQPHVDYQVVRLYEDLLERLTDILQPIPTELQTYVISHQSQDDWEKELWKIYNSTEDEGIESLYYLATEWWNRCRGLSTMHLNHGQNIWLWRTGDTVHIRWINESIEINGIQPWTAVKGDFKLNVDEFQKEVQIFHNRLIEEMGQRIEELKTKNPIPHINIDIPSLEKEHEERKYSLEKALNSEPCVYDWSEVVEATVKLLGPNKPN